MYNKSHISRDFMDYRVCSPFVVQLNLTEYLVYTSSSVKLFSRASSRNLETQITGLSRKRELVYITKVWKGEECKLISETRARHTQFSSSVCLCLFVTFSVSLSLVLPPTLSLHLSPSSLSFPLILSAFVSFSLPVSRAFTLNYTQSPFKFFF